MSRMISVDRLVHGLSADYMTGKKTLLQVIDEQPTAFDRYAVIEQLKEKAGMRGLSERTSPVSC